MHLVVGFTALLGLPWRSNHLLHTVTLLQAFSNPSRIQPMSTSFGTAHIEAASASTSVMDAALGGHDHGRDNPIQQRARAWARQRQQEQSVLTQHDASFRLRSQSSLPDAAARHHSLQHSALQPAQDTWRRQHSPSRNASRARPLGLARQLSEPSTSIDDEWPALGTPPVTLHLPHGPPLHLPPPSPVLAPRRSPQQAAAGTQTPAAFGLQWAANLARGAEWMGEATGLGFLTRPFSRTVAGMTGSAAAVTGGVPSSTRVGSEELPTPSSPDHRVSLDARASSLHGAARDQQVSASAPSNGSMSYRERLLAGSQGQHSSANRQSSGHSMVQISPPKQPPQGSQIGFPSQQELQATHGTPTQPPSTSGSTAPGPSSSSVPAVSALSLRHESQASTSGNALQTEAAGEAQTPAAQSSMSFAQTGLDHTVPQAVSVLPDPAQVFATTRGQYWSNRAFWFSQQISHACRNLSCIAVDVAVAN